MIKIITLLWNHSLLEVLRVVSYVLFRNVVVPAYIVSFPVLGTVKK